MVIDNTGELLVKTPNRIPKYLIDTFILSKIHWIESVHRKRTQRTQANPTPTLTENEIKVVKKEFKNDMLVFLNQQSAKMNVHLTSPKLSTARTRWGSCSSKGDINLNWRLALIPQALRHYVAIHELAHLKHMNHSREFWRFVEEYDPEYKANRKALKAYSHFLKEL